MSLVGVREKVIQSLDSMLADQDVSVRLAVVSTLGGFDDKSTVPALEKALKDPVPDVRFAAGKALYHLQEPDGKQFLLSVVSGKSKATSSYMTREERSTLRLMHTPMKLFTTSMETAAKAAPVPGLGFGVSSMQGILWDPASSARAAALLLVGRENDSAVLDAVRAALSDKEWSVRAAAIHVIAMRNDPEFRQDLVALLDDKKEAVRFRAAAAYLRLDRLAKEPPSKRAATN
jgi:HEAT repeat protein